MLTDLIWTHVPEIEIFTLDTGRLPEHTRNLIERLESRYQRRIKVYYPDPRRASRRGSRRTASTVSSTAWRTGRAAAICARWSLSRAPSPVPVPG